MKSLILLSILIQIAICSDYLIQDPSKIDPTALTVNMADYFSSTNPVCFCDKNENICDLNCCCDQECSQIQEWIYYKSCLNTENSYIISYSVQKQMNIQDLKQGLRLFLNILNQLLSVYINNFNQQQRVIVPQEDQLRNNLIDQRQAYLVENQNTKLANKIGTPLTLPSGQSWRLFGALNGANCQFMQQFLLNPFSLKPCQQKFTNFNQLCSAGSLGDPQIYRDLVVLNSVSVTIGKVYKIDQATGISIDTGSTTLQSPSASLQKCEGVMHQAFYKISLNADQTQVTQITLDIVLKDVNQLSGEMFVQQGTSLEYVNNAIPASFKRVGSYGYQLGNSIQIGKQSVSQQDVTKTAINLQSPFFSFGQVNGDQGLCYTPVTSTDDPQWNNIRNIQFGHSTYFSCQFEKNLADLKTFCDNSAVYLDNIYLNFKNQFHEKYIAKFANANPYKQQDWIQIQIRLEDPVKSFSTPTSIWTNDLQCTFNFPVLQIYYSIFGSKKDYFYVINRAEISFLKQKFQYKNIDVTQTQKFYQTTQVQFIPLQSKAQDFVVKPPKLNIYMPDDVLYPFSAQITSS